MPGQLDLRRAVCFEDEGTDRMHVVRRRTPLDPTYNRPVVAGRTAELPVAADQVIAGFEACYRLLLAHREALLSDDGPVAAFGGDSVRAVLRSTRVYANLLAESWHPDLLRDGADRDYLLELLAGRGSVSEYPAVLASERRQLSQQDVPVFEVAVEGTALADPSGEVVPGFFPRSGMSCVRERLSQLAESDLAEQVWYARAAFATLDADRRSPAEPTAGRIEHAEFDPAYAVNAACVVADRLVATCIRDSTGPEWVTLNRLGGRYWTVGATHLGLSSGVTGIALFLAELDGLVGEPRYRQLVEDLMAGLLDPDEAPDLDDLGGMPIGLFEDLGALLFLVVRLRELWGAGCPLDATDWLVASIRRNMETADVDDVVGGTAGAALALLALRRIHPVAEVDSTLRRAGEVLLDRAAEHRPRTGFGHGSAGCAYAMARVGQFLDDPAMIEAAVRLLEAEDRPPAGGRAGIGWCRGLSGNVLASSAMLAMPGLSPWRHDVRAALNRATGSLRRTAMPDGQLMGTGNDSICHGDLALAEALATSGAATGQEDLLVLSASLLAGVAHRARVGQLVTAAPTGLWVPGLRHGAAGVGHGLLHAAAPSVVPSILLPGALRER